MNLTKEHYVISRDLAKQLLDMMDGRWFIFSEGSEYNDDEVIAADKALQMMLQEQEESTAINFIPGTNAEQAAHWILCVAWIGGALQTKSGIAMILDKLRPHLKEDKT